MFAKKLRDMGQPVSLAVVEDLPHGFLSLSQLSKETEVASQICIEQMRKIFRQENQATTPRLRPKLEDTYLNSNSSAWYALFEAVLDVKQKFDTYAINLRGKRGRIKKQNLWTCTWNLYRTTFFELTT